jgi:hypothetical protein
MKNQVKNLRRICLVVLLNLASTVATAGLPQPPDELTAGSGKSWFDVGSTVINRGIGLAAIALGAIITLGVAAGVYRSWRESIEKQDLGHFTKSSLAGLVMLVMGLSLVYAGTQIG